MPRTCWDTSPLVSAAIRRMGIPRQLLDFSIARGLEIVVSPATLDELRDVLGRPHIRRRYAITDISTEEFIASIEEYALTAPALIRIDAVPDDPSDNHVIAAAVETECDRIVTGDQHLLGLGSYLGILIVSPRTLFDHLQLLENT